MKLLTLLWKCISILWLFIGSSQGKGSNPAIRYRAVRYGSYYSTVYFSYSGGKGYARYNRVYSHAKNRYPALYNYMFDWLKTDEFKVYKNSPSGFISVCKNYEANENGTYLGIFTCPLPFVPNDHSYCCGLTNAQYCCKFWDIPLNFAAAFLAILMGFVLFLTIIHVTIQLCINRRKTNEEAKQRKAIRRIGLLRRRGRNPSSGSEWARALFERVHAESTYSESSIVDEEDTEILNRKVQANVINTMKFLKKKSNNNDVINVTNSDSNDGKVCIDTDKLAPTVTKERAISVESGFIEETDACDGNVKKDTADNILKPSWVESTEIDDTIQPDYPLKPLKALPRISFNSDFNAKTFLASKYH